MEDLKQALVTLVFSTIVYDHVINLNDLALVINLVLPRQTSSSGLADLFLAHVVHIDVFLIDVADHSRTSVLSLHLKLHPKFAVAHAADERLLPLASFLFAVHVCHCVLLGCPRIN